jgi:type IV secretory pathway TrbD component
MPKEPNFHPVYRSINKPLTIWGVERGLFFMALIVGAAVFNFFSSLLSGVIMFIALYLFGCWATRTDPQILRIVLNSSSFKLRYDPGKWTEVTVQRTRRRD